MLYRLDSKWRFVTAAGIMLSSLWGCSSPLDKPHVNASKSAADALKKYDANGDGLLSAEELERAPGLKAAIKTTDTDSDSQMSKNELQKRIASYGSGNIPLLPFNCQILLDDKPLSDAQVLLVPEDILGSEIKTAAGKTDAGGNVNLAVDGLPFPGAHCGMFRMRISKLDGTGKETIPAKYNSQTELGFEVATDILGGERARIIRLKSD